MRILLSLSALSLLITLAACETMPNNQVATPTAGAAQAEALKPTPQAAADAGIDCNVVPRAKDQMAVYREYCL